MRGYWDTWHFEKGGEIKTRLLREDLEEPHLVIYETLDENRLFITNIDYKFLACKITEIFPYPPQDLDVEKKYYRRLYFEDGNEIDGRCIRKDTKKPYITIYQTVVYDKPFVTNFDGNFEIGEII